MLHVVLYQPEIPPNTGNIMRLCANTGTVLHLIHPLGFVLEDKRMRRAGLDYKEFASVIHYPNQEAFFSEHAQRRIFCCSTKATERYDEVQYQAEDMLLFGPETRGLPQSLLEQYPAIRIPMHAESRSLNLSNATAIILYEAWRQLGFV
ncbi:MAG: tRNA (uridine(34)/cytosine(34)/5-carboxymethylaminomethyluridine(34)-2'-O)-methyltransferase TrmL [Gammaproteobacteria bacterium]|nr:tRNA (uridine(34)/cytosine(34)/5-carboxymethylaminomethyluridine(34)-2'-O)-methyltransferase TrmL [Gammaproteobacteria bacterium]